MDLLAVLSYNLLVLFFLNQYHPGLFLQRKAISISSTFLGVVLRGSEGFLECTGAFSALPAEVLGSQVEAADGGFGAYQMVGGL